MDLFMELFYGIDPFTDFREKRKSLKGLVRYFCLVGVYYAATVKDLLLCCYICRYILRNLGKRD